MSGKWNIDIAGVSSVLGTVGEVAGKLQGEFTSYSNAMKNAGTHAGTIAKGGKAPEGGGGLVAAALAEFAKKTQDDLKYVAVRTTKSLTGAAEATKAYATGDMEMAANTQKSFSQAPTPEELAGKAKWQQQQGQGHGQGQGEAKA
ncbi:DUF6507 family protein [Streptomyces sp. NPDC053048]|uniref:DUF6507 family protein n=1 Tax=Streptomyces sp. NPDC053048 TaxID=3365694 RepID=UPI0037D5CA7B